MIPSLNAITDPLSPPFDLSIPDIYRYQIWKQDFEQNGPANFQMLWLSSDHTGGPSTPRAAVADGDLAVGKVVDEISHSKYWKDSAIFVVEDDSQAGVDHVDGHRARSRSSARGRRTARRSRRTTRRSRWSARSSRSWARSR